MTDLTLRERAEHELAVEAEEKRVYEIKRLLIQIAKAEQYLAEKREELVEVQRGTPSIADLNHKYQC